MTVRATLRIPPYRGQTVDVSRVYCDSEDEALGYAIRLLTECFGLPLEGFEARVISNIPALDCENQNANLQAATRPQLARR